MATNRADLLAVPDSFDKLANEELLKLRLCDLKLSIPGTWLQECVERLHLELRDVGFKHFQPYCWLVDEWCCPDGIPGIGIPFYLAHPRLMRLEKRMMFEVEGGNKKECMRLLRHEAGHALQHAYKLERRQEWRKVFGKVSVRYPTFYRPNPKSRRYVQHLDGWYAQSHPVEDFAETFATWLAPRSNWQERYVGWPALKKLKYIDRLVKELGDRPKLVRTTAKPYALSQLDHTLGQHYARRQKHYSPGPTREYDDDLRKIFSHSSRYRYNERAAAFLHRNQRELRDQVAHFTGEYRFTVDQVLRRMITRCKDLELRVTKGERKTKTEFAMMLTVHAVQLLHTRDRWHPL